MKPLDRKVYLSSLARQVRAVALLALVLVLFKSQLAGTEPVQYNAQTFTVYVVQQAWHTGIILNVSDIQAENWPGIADYRSYAYIGLGWGDEAFYQSQENLFWLGLKAALWPTSSVIRLDTYYHNPVDYYSRHGRSLALELDEAQFSNLCGLLAGSFKRDAQEKVIPSSLFPDHRNFYRAKGKYHLFNTCNTWVAGVLRKSGLSVRVFGILSARQLFRQLQAQPEALPQAG